MQFVHVSVRPTVVVALLCSAFCGHAMAQITQNPVTAQQYLGLLPGDKHLTVGAAAKSNNLFATGTGTSSQTFQEFSSNTGVLVGVAATLSIVNPSSYFAGAVPQNPAEGQIVSTWTLGGTASVTGQVNHVISTSNDTTYMSSNSWTALTLSSGDPTVLAGFVDKPVVSDLSSTMTVAAGTLANPNAKGGNSPSISGYIAATSNASGGAATSPLVQTSVTYSYLQHGEAVFSLDDGNGGSIPLFDPASTEIYLSDTAKSQDVFIDVLGSADGQVGIDVTGFNCVSTQEVCSHFSFTPASDTTFAGIAAGKALFKIGTVFTDDPVGNYTADFQLTYKDEAVGAANSRKLDSFAMLRVESGVTAVTAVPEPHSAAMLLAGLGAIGWMSRRRRSSRDQVAKL